MNTKTPKSTLLAAAMTKVQRLLENCRQKRREKIWKWQRSQRGGELPPPPSPHTHTHTSISKLRPDYKWELTWIRPVGVTSCPPLPHYACVPRMAASSEARLVTRCNWGEERRRSGNPPGSDLFLFFLIYFTVWLNSAKQIQWSFETHKKFFQSKLICIHLYLRRLRLSD